MTAGPGKRGLDVLLDPALNRSTAFTEEERDALGLTGLLPSGVDTPETQLRRVQLQLGSKNTDLGRYIYLTQLLDTNESLFYRVLMSDPARFLPIVYAPTVGQACLKFGHIFRRPRGMYLSLRHKGRVKEVLRNWPRKDVRIICVTSGGRILGLGDLGANGMPIAIGKLQLYTACAAIPPRHLLPMHIDCGTTNEALRADPLYLGLRQPRASAEEMDAFVEEFVLAAEEVFPGCCIHFEDWAGVDAVRLLEEWKDRVSCFNDDIQGTAGTTLAGLLTAVRITGSALADQRVLFLGAGAAAIGMADLFASALVLEGLSAEEARARIALFDVNGLVEATRGDLLPFQKRYAHALAPSTDFVATIEARKPTVLIGVSTKGGAFTREVVEAMARLNRRPVIMALSNPTERAECTAEDAYLWSEGRALFAAGVPFPPVPFGVKTLRPSQGNNMYIFPAVGLAVFATRARRVTDEMFVAAARGVADQVTEADVSAELLFPPQRDILRTEIKTALRVCEVIFRRGLAGVPEPADLPAYLESLLYRPR